MIQSFQSRGVWFLPGKDDEPTAGTLTFSPRDGLTLALTGTLSDVFGDLRSDTYPVIHGVLADSPYGRIITLVDSFRTRSTLSIPGFSSEEIRAQRAYVGAHFLDEEAVHFDAFRAQYTYLAEWHDASGFSRYIFERSGDLVTMEYRRPARRELSFDRGSIGLEALDSTNQEGRRAAIEEKIYATGKDLREKTAPQIVEEFIRPFQDFLSFAVDAPCAVEELVLTRLEDETSGGSRKSPVHVLYQPIFWPSETERRQRVVDQTLFTCEEASSRQPSPFARWMVLREELRWFYKAFASNRYAQPRYLETKFLSTLVALTLFFADQRVRPRSPRPDISFSGAMDRAATERDRRWLEYVLPADGELALPWMLSAILEKYSEIFSEITRNTAEQFITDVLAVRRKLTIGAVDQMDMEPRELLTMNEALNLLLKICVLEFLGFEEVEVRRRIPLTRAYLTLLALKRDDSGAGQGTH